MSQLYWKLGFGCHFKEKLNSNDLNIVQDVFLRSRNVFIWFLWHAIRTWWYFFVVKCVLIALIAANYILFDWSHNSHLYIRLMKAMINFRYKSHTLYISVSGIIRRKLTIDCILCHICFLEFNYIANVNMNHCMLLFKWHRDSQKKTILFWQNNQTCFYTVAVDNRHLYVELSLNHLSSLMSVIT